MQPSDITDTDFLAHARTGAIALRALVDTRGLKRVLERVKPSDSDNRPFPLEMPSRIILAGEGVDTGVSLREIVDKVAIERVFTCHLFDHVLVYVYTGTIGDIYAVERTLTAHRFLSRILAPEWNIARDVWHDQPLVNCSIKLAKREFKCSTFMMPGSQDQRLFANTVARIPSHVIVSNVFYADNGVTKTPLPNTDRGRFIISNLHRFTHTIICTDTGANLYWHGCKMRLDDLLARALIGYGPRGLGIADTNGVVYVSVDECGEYRVRVYRDASLDVCG